MTSDGPRQGTAPTDRSVSTFEYDAFISYRRTEPDKTIATRLHLQLESFRLAPGRLKLRICMDQEEFVAGSSLPQEVERRLRASRFLIVLCTPAAVASHWVQAEVQSFVEAGRTERILLVLAAGEPKSAFPTALGHEVLAADIRAESPRERWRKLEIEKLRLLAPILECDFSDLQQREARRRAQRLRNVATIGTLLAGLFAVIAAYAWRAKARAEVAEKLALAQQRRADEAAIRATDAARVVLASSVADSMVGLLSLREVKREDAQGFVPAALAKLASPVALAWLRGHAAPVTTATFSADGKHVVTGSDDCTARVWSVDGSGQPIILKGHTRPIRSIALSPDGSRVLTGSEDGTARVWNIDGSAPPIILQGHDQEVNSVGFSR